MSGFEEVKFNEIQDKVGGPKDVSKKPVLAFKLQKSCPRIIPFLQGSVTKVFSNPEQHVTETKNKLSVPLDVLKKTESISQNDNHKDLELSYKEPSWSGTPEDIYKVDILKSGVILKSLDLSYKSYHVIGKSLSCDISLTHETITQFHAILQYRKISDTENEMGMYIYDLNSQHGTFLNEKRIEPNKYILLYNGFMIRFGNSQRKYILRTSKDKAEKEAGLSVDELQELKRLELQEQERLDAERLLKEKERLKNENDAKGINWGIAEDIDENSRLTESSENSESDNEELFLDDPKKALRDWFKWEGYDLEYQTEDRGFGRFSCRIDLTLDAVGTTERIEVHVFGDKMKAIDKCALESCRVLNKYGFLKQAREEKKSTSRNWEEVDYYDSDEDNFLDRTGIIEKKRQQRMQMAGKLDSQIETYNSLLEKHSKIVERIKHLEKIMTLHKAKQDNAEDSEEDALDAFMSNLDTSVLNKAEIRNMKMELHNLYQEEMLVLKSINVNKTVNAGSSISCPANITEKTKNGCRFNT